MDGSLLRFSDTEFSLEGLVRVAGQLVTVAGLDQSDGRVAELPDSRGVRYYQSCGLVAKPIRYDGRQAVYGYRHLLQLVAVKLLQADGMSLAQVQRALAGLTARQLETVLVGALYPATSSGPGRARDVRHLHDAQGRPGPANRQKPAPSESETELGGSSESGTELSAPSESETEPGGSSEFETELSAPSESETELGAPSVSRGPHGGHPVDAQPTPANRLVAREVMPGIIVTIDTAQWPSPDPILSRIRRCLERLQGVRQ